MISNTGFLPAQELRPTGETINPLKVIPAKAGIKKINFYGRIKEVKILNIIYLHTSDKIILYDIKKETSISLQLLL